MAIQREISRIVPDQRTPSLTRKTARKLAFLEARNPTEKVCGGGDWSTWVHPNLYWMHPPLHSHFEMTRQRRLEKPSQRLHTKQQTACHFVSSRRTDHMLIHRQDITQAAVQRSLLVDRRTSSSLEHKLHNVRASPDNIRMRSREIEQPASGWAPDHRRGCPTDRP